MEDRYVIKTQCIDGENELKDKGINHEVEHRS